MTLAVFAAIISACSVATYQERLDYLRTVASRGAETHALIQSQEAPITPERCADAYEAINDSSTAPSDMAGGGQSPVWRSQIKAFFVDSCVSGKPRSAVASDVPAPPTPNS